MDNYGTVLSLSLPETWDCIVCGKHFYKKKSLGGHLKRHPERPWRGLYPPPTGESYACDIVAFLSLPINLTLKVRLIRYNDYYMRIISSLKPIWGIFRPWYIQVLHSQWRSHLMATPKIFEKIN